MTEVERVTDARAALVFAAGDPPPATVTDDVVRRSLAAGAFVVAADGGLVHAAALGVQPDLIVGDFDSVPDDLLDAYPAELTRRHPVAKDELDLELALNAAVERGASRLSVIGAFGGRFDHSLAALLVAARLAGTGLPVDLHGGPHSAWTLAAGMTVEPSLPLGTTVSILSLAGGSLVTADGLAFPLTRLRLPFGSGLGMSNVTTHRSVTITCDSGLVAVIAERGETRVHLGLPGA